MARIVMPGPQAPRTAPVLVAPNGAPLAPTTAPAAVAPPARVALYGKRITVVCAACPKLPGTKAAARWALYRNGQTVAEFLAAAKQAGHTHPASDVRYNVAHGYITLA